MPSLVTVKKEVEKLREGVAPKPKDELWVVAMWPWDRDKPHGKYGMQKLEIHIGKHEAVSEEEELKLLRESFESIPLEVRERAPYWFTWENFLEYHRCRRGKHDS